MSVCALCWPSAVTSLSGPARCRAEESEFRLLQNEVRLSYFPDMAIIKARFISVKQVIIFNRSLDIIDIESKTIFFSAKRLVFGKTLMPL